jgi:hypothetical protein
MFSDRCRKIASKHLAKRYSQITSNYSAIHNRQIAIVFLAIKEHQIVKSI